MSDEFDYEEVAAIVLEEHGQAAAFRERFVKFCQNAMEGKAEEMDLVDLIEKVDLSDDEDL
jgi:hypothetical protein